MAEEHHPHSHTNEVSCTGDECDHERKEHYTHTHAGGHEIHTHKPEGVRLIKLEEVIEPKPEPEPESKRSHSPIWDGPEDAA
jgi:hypothetical protein